MSRSKRGKSNNDEFTNEQQSQLEAALQKESQLIDINASRRNEEQFIKFWNQIAKAVKGKGAAQCLNRYQKIRNNMKSPKTTGPVVPSQILKKSSNDTSKKIKSTKSTKTIKTTITKTTKAQPKAKVQTNKPVTTKSAVKVISSKSIAKPEPETKVPTPRKVAPTPVSIPSAPVPVQPIPTAPTPTAPKPTAALPFPTKPPSPWNQLEHHQLESAIKETRTMQDKRERWKLIGTKVSTRSARECLAKFKEMREALLANK